MRKMVAAALASSIAAWGCSSTQDASAPSANIETTLESAISPPGFMGTWTVTGHLIPGISAMSEAEASAWHGTILQLGEALAISNENRCAAPRYSTEAVLTSQLLADFKLPPGRLLALDALDRATVLQVSCHGAPWGAMGGRVIGISADEALAPWDGVFFELVRVR
jgi:hypothetical protein